MFGTQCVTVQGTRIIGLTDNISGKSSPIKLAIAFSKKRRAMKFLTGILSPQGPSAISAWIPLYGKHISDSVQAFYRANDIEIKQVSWSRSLPTAPKVDGKNPDEYVMIISAVASKG